MTAFYNENNPYAAQWLRNLIEAGHIAPGIVDERSISDIKPEELHGFTQCHFFAGIGVWSLALRRAGWPDDRRVWTGSCPCQPFSSAGKGAGFDDERHLWPHFHWLIQQCKPPAVLGEQVASKDAEPWLDLVQADLEAMGYAFGAVPFPSASIGAPHIRDRLYWVADAYSGQQQWIPVLPRHVSDRSDGRWAEGGGGASACRFIGRVADAERINCGCEAAASDHWESQTNGPTNRPSGYRCSPCGMVNTDIAQPGISRGVGGSETPRVQCRDNIDGRSSFGGLVDCESGEQRMARPGPVNGYWDDADWLRCKDGRWRPVEPGTFPLAHGAPSRVGRLRAYGNALNAEAARIFIASYIESRQEN